MKKPTILYPLNPRVGDLMKRLKDQCNSCNWYKPNSIPECLLPLLKRILKIAERYNLLNENFYEHLRLSLKYQYNENIEFLKVNFSFLFFFFFFFFFVYKYIFYILINIFKIINNLLNINV